MGWDLIMVIIKKKIYIYIYRNHINYNFIISFYIMPSVISQLLSVPPYFCAGISAVIVAVISDRKVVRSPFIITGLLIAILGYILLAVPSVGIPGKQIYFFL